MIVPLGRVGRAVPRSHALCWANGAAGFKASAIGRGRARKLVTATDENPHLRLAHPEADRLGDRVVLLAGQRGGHARPEHRHELALEPGVLLEPTLIARRRMRQRDA